MSGNSESVDSKRLGYTGIFGPDSNSNRQSAIRFNDQTHLMLFWERYVQKNDKNKYTQFGCIDAKNPFEVINVLFKKSDRTDILLNLTAAEMSLLVPKIRLYKQYIDPETKKAYSVELLFDDITSKKRIEDITNTAVGRGGGTGVTSFSWTTLGTNPADKYTFSAKLELYFQNIEEIFNIREIRQIQFSGNRTIDVPVRFSDLILYPKELKKDPEEGSRVYDPDAFILKADVGWYIQDNVEHISKEVRDELNKINQTMYLGLHSHEIKINDDGSVKLTVNYIARLDILIESPVAANILNPPQYIQDNIDRLQKTAEEEEKQKKENPGNIITNAFTFDTDTKENLERYQLFQKTDSYVKILNNILASENLRYTYASKDYLDKVIQVKAFEDGNLDLKSINEIKQVLAETKQKNEEETGIVQQKSLAQIESLPGQSIKEVKEEFLKLTKDFKLPEKPDHYLITYFYLGDLIEAVLKDLFNPNGQYCNFPEKEVKVMLGPITFYDYGSLEDSGLLIKTKGLKNGVEQYERLFTGKATSVNIADIPISVKTFSNWFIEKVIDPGKTKYFFKDFIDDILNDLVIRSLGPESISFTPKQQARVKYRSVSLPANSQRNYVLDGRAPMPPEGEQFSTVDQEKEYGYVFNLDEMDGFAITDSRSSQDGTFQKIDNFLFIYGSEEAAFSLKADYDQDLKRGIYHLFYGAEHGMVKEINFKRTDIPYMNEANLQNNLPDKQGRGYILRGRYDADIEMFGNNIFEVGGRLYIAPTLAGSSKIGNRLRLVRELGIGGYFKVNEIVNKIEEGSYQTSLTTVWEARGDGTINIGEKEYLEESVIKASQSNVSEDRVNARIVPGNIK